MAAVTMLDWQKRHATLFGFGAFSASELEMIALWADQFRAMGFRPDELVAFVRKLRDDPVAWIEAATGKRLWSKQREIIRAAMVSEVLCVPTWTCHSPLTSCTVALSGSMVAWQTMSVVYSTSSVLSAFLRLQALQQATRLCHVFWPPFDFGIT